MHSSLAATLEVFPIVPLAGAVLFPGVVLAVTLPGPSRLALGSGRRGRGPWLVSMVRPGGEANNVARVHAVGCLARPVQAKVGAGGRLEAWLEGTGRARLTQELAEVGGVRCARAELPPPPPVAAGLTRGARWARLREEVRGLIAERGGEDPELAGLLEEPRAPWAWVDLLGALLVPEPAAQQALLEAFDPDERLEATLAAVARARARRAVGTAPRPRRAGPGAPGQRGFRG